MKCCQCGLIMLFDMEAGAYSCEICGIILKNADTPTYNNELPLALTISAHERGSQ